MSQMDPNYQREFLHTQPIQMQQKEPGYLSKLAGSFGNYVNTNAGSLAAGAAGAGLGVAAASGIDGALDDMDKESLEKTNQNIANLDKVHDAKQELHTKVLNSAGKMSLPFQRSLQDTNINIAEYLNDIKENPGVDSDERFNKKADFLHLLNKDIEDYEGNQDLHQHLTPENKKTLVQMGMVPGAHGMDQTSLIDLGPNSEKLEDRIATHVSDKEIAIAAKENPSQLHKDNTVEINQINKNYQDTRSEMVASRDALQQDVNNSGASTLNGTIATTALASAGTLGGLYAKDKAKDTLSFMKDRQPGSNGNPGYGEVAQGPNLDYITPLKEKAKEKYQEINTSVNLNPEPHVSASSHIPQEVEKPKSLGTNIVPTDYSFGQENPEAKQLTNQDNSRPTPTGNLKLRQPWKQSSNNIDYTNPPTDPNDSRDKSPLGYEVLYKRR